MARLKLQECDKVQLLAEIELLDLKLKRRRSELARTKAKLANYRDKVNKMKATIAYQRSRILQLYKEGTVIQA